MFSLLDLRQGQSIHDAVLSLASAYRRFIIGQALSVNSKLDI